METANPRNSTTPGGSSVLPLPAGTGLTGTHERDVTSEVADLLTEMPWWAARGLIYVILSFLATAILWSHFSMMNEIVEARGRLIAESKVQPVQSATTGLVQSVRVREGELVNRDQTLIYLTPQVGTGATSTTIKAPITGIITRLDVRSPRTLVQNGQLVATIAPLGSRLIVEAHVPNKDIALIVKGLSSKLKFDAFPIQDYNIISGTLVEISPDAQADEKAGSFYRVIIALPQTSIAGKNNTVPLRPGLLLTAEIITKRRSVLSLFLEPFRKLKAGI